MRTVFVLNSKVEKGSLSCLGAGEANQIHNETV